MPDRLQCLIYLRERYYNTLTRRFINPDPARDGWNWYAYAGGDPMGFVDPTGLGQQRTLDILQKGLAVLGMLPGVGEIFDVVNAGISFARGNYADAAIHLASAIPGVGNAVAGAKMAGGITTASIGFIKMQKAGQPLMKQGASIGQRSFLNSGNIGQLGHRANEGIYEFVSTSGQVYVGQSSNIAKRLNQHIKSGNLAKGTQVKTTEVLGGKTAREIAEQVRINELGGIQNLKNIRNPIGPNRKHLLP